MINKRGWHLVMQWYVLFAFIIILIAIFFIGPRLTPTGLLVYEETTGKQKWDFSNSQDYTYDNKINLSNKNVQLIPTMTSQTTTRTTANQNNIVSATLYKDNDNPEDKTTKVNSLSNGNVELNNKENNNNKDNYILETNFANPLSNGDIISLYIMGESASSKNIYFCDSVAGCDNGVFGQFTLPSNVNNGWYNITLSGINSPRANFYIDSADKLKIDAITSYKITTTTETTIITSYPSSAILQTVDLQPTNWKRWGTFSKTHQLNGQGIQYQYSTNSGNSWLNVPDDGNLSSVNTGKIRIKAVLNSNGSNTPVISEINLDYLTQASCTEDWSCTTWNSCMGDNTQTRTCSDNAHCSTTANKPSETQSCVYVAPCVENWNTYFNNCQINDQQLKYYLDGNNCSTFNNVPSDNGTFVSCDFCTLNLVNTSWSDWLDTDSCLLNDTKPQQRTLIQYDSNQCGEIDNSTFTEERILPCDYCTPSWQEVNNSCQSNNTLTSWFNDTNNCYVLTNLSSDNLPPSNNNYSCEYSAPAPETSPSPNAPSSGGGGGGGGSSSRIAQGPPIETSSPNSLTKESSTMVFTPKQVLIKGIQELAGKNCEYVLEVSLPQNISLLENNQFSTEITNKGNCDIEGMNLYLSPELDSIANLSTLYLDGLKQDEKTRVLIIRKSQSEQKGLFSFLTGAVTASFTSPKTFTGAIILEGIEKQQTVFRQNLTLNIEVLVNEKITAQKLVSSFGLYFVIFILGMVFIYAIIKRSRRQCPLAKRRKKEKEK